jgi:hypothetical protein
VISRIATILVVIGAVVGVACVDMSAPKGAASISALQLPSPSVVVGDVMRDSTGAPANLSVIAYDANGGKITDLATQFFVTDTGAPATLDASGMLTGTKVGTVHVVGQIGALQTPVAAIPITVAPKLIARADTITRVDTVHASTDTTQHDFVPAAVKVSGDSGVGVVGFVVKFTLVHAPATKSTSKAPAVFLADDQLNPSTVATTDASGQASRKVVVVGALLADTTLASLLSGKRDSAVVTAQTSYKGALISPSPIRIVIPIVATVKLP